MTVYWACLVCEASGTTDAAGERHVRDTRHGVMTYARPRIPRTSIPFTLTDKGWAATCKGWVP